MKNLNDRTSALEGKASTTPITMKGLADRLANLEATAKKWEEATLIIRSGTSVYDTVSLPLPQNIKNIVSGAKSLATASGTVHWYTNVQDGTVSANSGSIRIDNNYLYYQLRRGSRNIASGDITIKLVVYK
jgi:tRNA G37 N-methylase Trm5